MGDSRDEVEQLIHEATEFHLEGMREEGLAIPAASSFAGAIEINTRRDGVWQLWQKAVLQVAG